MNLRYIPIILVICSILIDIFPATAISPDPPGMNILVNSNTSPEIRSLTLAGSNSTEFPSLSDNTSGNASVTSATVADGNSQYVINGQLYEKRIIGPGLPPKGWDETTALADMSDITGSVEILKKH